MLCEQLLDLAWIKKTLHRLFLYVDFYLSAFLGHGLFRIVECGDGQNQVDANCYVAGNHEGLFPIDGHCFIWISYNLLFNILVIWGT